MTQGKRPITLINGASAGIGAALAHEFATHGHELVLVARREQVLGALADAIAAKGASRPTVLGADLARPDAAQAIAAARVARDGYHGFKEGQRVVVPGSANRALRTFAGFAPRSLLLSLIGRRQDRRR